MNRYICSYGMKFNNPFDCRRLILVIKAQSEAEALNIAMDKVKDSDKNGWDINEIVETENEQVEAVIVICLN